MTADRDRLYKKLDHVGEHVVRANLANGVYGENRRDLVEEWLEQFQNQGEAVEEESLELASEEDRPAIPEARPDKWYQRWLRLIRLPGPPE
jgi:hypothetical protein